MLRRLAYACVLLGYLAFGAALILAAINVAVWEIPDTVGEVLEKANALLD